MQAIKETPSINKQKGFLHYLKNDWQLYILLIIPLLFVIIFKYLPMFGLVIVFEDYKIGKGFIDSKWVGLQNFIEVFSHRDFIKAFRNTLLLNILELLLGFPMPIILALVLNEIKGKYFKRINQTLLYLPHFLSWVIIGGLAYQLFRLSDGVINNLIELLGGVRFPFLQENTPWLISYTIIGVWQGMGWGTIIYLAAITSVNPELYEAARVDGANRWQQCLNITLPCIRSTIVTLLIMNLGKIVGGSFERVNSLMNFVATEYTSTIPVLVYKWGIGGGQFEFSKATTLGLFQSVIGLIMVLLADYIAKKLGEDGLL